MPIISLDEYEDISLWETGFPSLDFALGGGFIEGSTVLLYGKPRMGKSTLAWQLVAKAQKEGYISLIVMSEGKFSKDYLLRLGIEENSKVKILEVKEDAETHLDEIMGFITLNPVKLLIIDSLASLSSKVTTDKKFSDKESWGALARLAAGMFQKFTPVVNAQKMIFLVINQERESINYSGVRLPGGVSQQFYASHILRFKKGKKETEDFKEVKIEVQKSRLRKEGVEINMFLQENKGFSRWYSLIDYMMINNLVQRKGAYYSITLNGEEVRGQGMANFVSALQKVGSVEDIMKMLKKNN